MSKKHVLLVAGALATLALAAPLDPAAAQQVGGNAVDNAEVLIARMQADKRALVLENLGLSDAEVRVFAPLYDEYQKDRKLLFERGAELLSKYASNYDTMTDDAAKGILKDWFKQRDDRSALVQKYAKRMVKVLPAGKVLRWVQIENKLDTVIDMQAVRNLPLVQ